MARTRSVPLALASLLGLYHPLGAQSGVDFLIPAGTDPGLPVADANDNRTPAGTLRGGTLELSLSVVRAAWHPEGAGAPGLRVAAFAETGRLPSVPAPLIRVETGTRIRITLRNELTDTSVAFFGFHPRPGPRDSVIVAARGTQTLEFVAGPPGTYLYRAREAGPRQQGDRREREQLAGAFVIDPVGGSPDDRVFVMNVFSEPVDTTVTPWGALEGVTINGREFPHTERVQLQVGRSERWRWVNATIRDHPMHLHGFYYDVLSRGTRVADTIYAERDRRKVVTETMLGFTTMTMEWTPTRPGNWLFHCHLSFHVTPRLRLPAAPGVPPAHAAAHMSGLVLGLEVAPGPSDLVAKGDVLKVDLYARQVGDRQGYRYAFTTDTVAAPGPDDETPGPPLIFEQFRPVDVTVHNRLPFPTGVHWHGLELAAWSDGVPEWSRSDGRVSPAIEPGGSFTYRLSTMRPGTFIYHSHMNDIDQLTGGLYGPLIVVPPGEKFDTTLDHILTFGWRSESPQGLEDVELNGLNELPPARTSVGQTHRFRLINIGPAGVIFAWLRKDGVDLPIRLFAKDGADLPEHQRVEVMRLPLLDVGETADFTWTPSEPGTYELFVGPAPQAGIGQTWEVVRR
jgi:FtsP/CotA-like multicopper oxidase with cupredoxin domain